jgi:uncharacterized protein (DUF58 family)
MAKPSKTRYLDPAEIAQLRGLSLRARKAVEGFLSGEHPAHLRGESGEFAEHRKYSPGDDLNRLDWKIFARTDRFYLKQFEEETNLDVHLVVDTSRSMNYQSDQAPLSKLDYARTIAAALGYLILSQRDRVGLVTFDEQIHHQMPPSDRPTGWKQLVDTLEIKPQKVKSNLRAVLYDLAGRLTHCGIVVVLSDFLDSPESIFAGLKQLCHRRHELILIHLVDPSELSFPFSEPTQFNDLETGQSITADPAIIREAYLAEIDRHLQAMQTGCRRFGIDYLGLATDQHFDRPLTHYLHCRGESHQPIIGSIRD